MSGEKKLEESLDEFCKDTKLNINTAPETPINELIELADCAEKLTPEACLELAMQFNSYSFYIKRVHNRQVAKFNTYNSAINRFAARYWNDYGNIYGNDIKINIIANEYDTLKEYIDIRNKTKRYIDEIDGLCMTIDKYTTLLQNYARLKDE